MFSDPGLEYNRGGNARLKLTVEQQCNIYDSFYGLGIPMSHLAQDYHVHPRTIQGAIEREQIRRINTKALFYLTQPPTNWLGGPS